MKRVGILIVLLIFILSGCEDKPELKSLSSYINTFETAYNQFKVEISFEIDMTQDDQTTTITEGMTGYVQKDPYYSSMSTEDLTIVEFIEHNELKTYTMSSDLIVNGIQLYSYHVVSINSLHNPLENLDFDFRNVFIEQMKDNQFKVEGKLTDLLPESLKNDFKSDLLALGLTNSEIDNISIEMLFIFDDNSLEYNITMNLTVEQVDFEFRIEVLYIHENFQLIDFSDATKYFPLSSTETENPIDINNPIIFESDRYQISQYLAYFEAGKYGFDSNIEAEYHDILLYGEENEPVLKVFNDLYDRYTQNTDNISHFYNIPVAGYYTISINYPVSEEPYIIHIEKVEPITDGTESPTLTITESGTYDYEIESQFDFFSIDFDLEQNALVTIKDSNQNFIYTSQANVNKYINLEIHETGFTQYIDTSNHMLYLNNPYGSSVGTLTVEITPVVHALNPDESMYLMQEEFNDINVITGNFIPDQYIAIEVSERNRYTFEYLMISGDIDYAKGTLYYADGRVVCSVVNNHSVNLLPGKYYYQSSHDYTSVYSIRYVISDIDETTRRIYNLRPHDLLGDDPELYPHYNGTIFRLGELVVYEFSLSETTDVGLNQSNQMFALYDSMGNRMDIANYSGLFIYRLLPGDYFITITPPNYYTETYFPVSYTLTLFKFTGSGSDTSVFPFLEEIRVGTRKTSTVDYPRDIDGFTFTLTETTTIRIMSNYEAFLVYNNRIIGSRIEDKEYTLEAGTYTVLCQAKDTWSVRVMYTS